MLKRRIVLTGNWLSRSAIVALAVASGALNAWGWCYNSTGLAVPILIVLVAACEILGLRLAESLGGAFDPATRKIREPLRFAIGCALFAGVIAFNGYSGEQALRFLGQAQKAAFEQGERDFSAATADATAARAIVSDLRNGIAKQRVALAALPTDIPAARIDALQRPRMAVLAGLDRDLAVALATATETNQRAADLSKSRRPRSPSLDAGVIGGIVVLIEMLKALGLWMLGGRPAAALVGPAIQTGAFAGRELLDRLLGDGLITRGDIASAQARSRWNTAAA